MVSDDGDACLLSPSASSLSLASSGEACESDGGLDGGSLSLLDCATATVATDEESLLPSLLPADSGLAASSCDRPAWIPGASVVGFIGRGMALGVQAQVVLVNVIHNLKGISRGVLRALQGALSIQSTSEDKLSYAVRVGARLLGMQPATVSDAYRRVRDNSWNPVANDNLPLAGQSLKVPRVGGMSPTTDEVQACLRNTVRAVLAHAVDGGSWTDLCNTLARLQLAGANISMAATNRDFAKAVVAFGSLTMSHLDAEDYNGELRGLGIPSDFALLADPVSLGVGPRARHDTLCVLCLCLASRWTGRLYTPMFSAPAMPIGAHAGEAMAALLLNNMKQHPAQWGLSALRARCAVVCGDGALCEGGPEHRHSSTAAAEKFWRKLYPAASPHGRAHLSSGEAPPLCTVWDPFHRIDAGAWRAIASVPMAVRVFDISKELDHLFGQGEGVLFFRGVGVAMGGDGSRTLRAPGGTRKIGYLSGTPGALLENYKLVMGGLHARAAWSQQGHRHQSLAHMMELSRTLADVSFVVFCCVFTDIMRLALRPFVLQVQGVLEPAVFKQCEKRVMAYLAHVRQQLPALRGLFRVVSLLRQHVPVADLCKLVAAYRWSALGRCFPTLFEAVPNLFAQPPTYGGVELQLVQAVQQHDSLRTMCLGPSCQCDSRLRQHLAVWADLLAPGARGRPPPQGQEGNPQALCPAAVACPPGTGAVACPPGTGTGRLAGVSVPRYVAFPSDEAKRYRCAGPCSCTRERPCPRYCAGLLSTPPRFTQRPRAPRPPAGINMTGLFRHTWSNTNASVCQVAYTTYALHSDIDDALVQAGNLCDNLSQELRAMLYKVGMNDSMSELLTAAGACWDWRILAFQGPEVRHIHAFKTMATALQPCMVNTQYPLESAFAHVRHRWPGISELCGQYLWLARRVRWAMAAGTNFREGLPLHGGRHQQGRQMAEVPEEIAKDAQTWTQTVDYAVLPVWVNNLALYLVKALLPKTTARLLQFKVACLVSGFVGLPLEAYSMLYLKASELRAGGPGRRRRSKRTPEPATVSFRRGDICVDRARRLVYIVTVRHEVAVEKVTTSIMMHPWFSIGNGPKGFITWHAARLAHRCSLLFPPEAPCERMGSLLRLYWEPRRNLGPVDMADLVLLSQAGVRCVGSQRDEVIVEQVAALLQATAKYKFGGGGGRIPLSVLEHQRNLAESGRFAGQAAADVPALVALGGMALEGAGYDARREFVGKRRKVGTPVELPGAAAHGLQRGQIGDVVVPLKVDVPTLHAGQRGATRSVLKEKTKAWLESEAGLEWQKERQKFFAPEEVEEDESTPLLW